MVATTDKKAAAKPAKGKEGSKKLPAVPETVLKHRKRRDALRARRVQVMKMYFCYIIRVLHITFCLQFIF